MNPKILKVYRSLQEVAVCQMPDGTIQFYAMAEDPAEDPSDEKNIINQLQVAFKVIFDK